TAAPTPGLDARCPFAELARGITARVKLARTVQPHVHEVRRHVPNAREESSRIGDARRNPILPQQLHESRLDEARMADLQRMANGLIGRGPGLASTRQSLIVSSGELGRLPSRARQELEKRPELRRIEHLVRGKLPQNWPEFLA